MKILSSRAHGAVDVAFVIAFAVGPRVLGFDGIAATVASILAPVYLALLLATRFPFGLVRIVPFPLHGLIEFAVGIVLLALPWLLGFSNVGTARSFYVGAGASVLVTFWISDYTSSGTS